MSFRPPHSWAALSESDTWWRLQWVQSRSTVELAERLVLPLEDVQERLRRAGIDQLRGRPPEGQRILFELPPRQRSRFTVRLTPASEMEAPVIIEIVDYTRKSACHAARALALATHQLTSIAAASVIRKEPLHDPSPHGPPGPNGADPDANADAERTRPRRADRARPPSV